MYSEQPRARWGVLVAIAALVGALLLFPMAGESRGASPPPSTVTHNLSIGPVGFTSRTFNVPKFDPALGTLQSVELSGTVHDATYYALEFLCTGASGRGALTFTNHNWAEFTWGSTTEPCGSGGESLTLVAGNNFDGVLDVAGTSGRHVFSSYVYGLGIQPLQDPGDLATFTGSSGTTPVTVTLHKFAWYQVPDEYPNTCWDHAIASADDYTYGLSVTYTFQ